MPFRCKKEKEYINKLAFLCDLSGTSGYKRSKESFLFSLVNPSGAGPTKIPLKGTKNQNGIFCDSGYGPTFGGGHDLYIGSGANEDENSSSNLGHSYQSVHANSTFLAGQDVFVVSELEVFVLQANQQWYFLLLFWKYVPIFFEM